MSQVKSKNTKPEIILFELLKFNRISYRKHYDIPGKPDIAFPKLKLAVFIDGEFWHGRDFDKWKYKLSSFWLEKISKNIERDKLVKKFLKKEGWRVLRIWDKDIIKNPNKTFRQIRSLINAITS